MGDKFPYSGIREPIHKQMRGTLRYRPARCQGWRVASVEGLNSESTGLRNRSPLAGPYWTSDEDSRLMMWNNLLKTPTVDTKA